MRYLRIPEERVPILVGENGETLTEIQELVDATIHVDGQEIEIERGDDPMEEIRAYNIVKAIGRGFKPERALRLLEDNSDLCIININDFADTDNSKRRLKGRVIGQDGRTREKLEKDTDTEISVYGKTVSILGKMQNVEIAREAVHMLLNGRSHATVYAYLKRNQSKIV